jgi:hypothetical protein
LSLLNEYLNKFYLKKLQILLINSNNENVLYRENYINYLLTLFSNHLKIQKYINLSNKIFDLYYDKNINNNFDKFYLYESLFSIVQSTNYEKLKNIYLKTRNVNIKNKSLLAMANTTDINILKKLVNNDDNLDIKEQDIYRFYCELIKNKIISDYAFDILISKNSPIYKLDNLVFIHFLKCLSQMLFDKDKIDKLIHYFNNDLDKKELLMKTKQNLDILLWHKKI